MAVETIVGGLLLNGSFEQGSGENAYNWLQEFYEPTYDAETVRGTAYHYHGGWCIHTYSVGTDGWARATSDAFTLRAKQLIYYWLNHYGNPRNCKFQLLLASNDSLLAEDAFGGSGGQGVWYKRTLDVSAHIGVSVKVRVWSTTGSHGAGCRIHWDFIREDIPSWVHKCVGDLGRERLALTESLALLESLPSLDRALSPLEESLALLEDLTQYARGLPLEESIALKEEETASISSLLTESLALKESLPTLERALTLEESLALLEALTEESRALTLEEALALLESLPTLARALTLSENLALLESETADIQALMAESLALKEDLTQLGRALTLEESLAFLEDAHAETLLFEVDKDGNIIYMGTLDEGAF